MIGPCDRALELDRRPARVQVTFPPAVSLVQSFLQDQLRLAAFEAEDRLPRLMLDAIQRAGDLLEGVGGAVQPHPSGSLHTKGGY